MNKFDRPDIVTYVVSKHITFMIVWDKIVF